MTPRGGVGVQQNQQCNGRPCNLLARSRHLLLAHGNPQLTRIGAPYAIRVRRNSNGLHQRRISCALTVNDQAIPVLDVDSFATLLTNCYQRCWLIAVAVTGDRVEADDVVQEASIIALRKLADFTVGTNFTAWISQIVRLTALNHVKKSSRSSIVATDPVMIDRTGTSSVGSAKEVISITEDGRLVEPQLDFDDEVLLALREISDEARACLLLRAVERLSYREISQTLQIPEGTAMSHVHRAKHAMRQRLKNRREQSSKVSMNEGQR